MNTKVANLIAAQFGILIGLMVWLVYMQFQSAEPRSAAVQDSATAPYEEAAPASEALHQRPYAADYRTAREQSQLLNQRTVQPVQYYQTIVEPSTASDSGSDAIPAVSSSYSDVDQGAAAVPSDYVVSPQPYYYYAEPAQIIVINDSRRFRNRRSKRHQINAPGQIANQFPDRRNHDIRIPDGPPPPPRVPLPPAGPPPPPAGPPPPPGGFQPRGNTRQVINPAPRRVAFPGAPRTVRPTAAVP